MRIESNGFWFKSSLFAIEPNEDEETNPQRFGRQLAKWIGEQVRGLGFTPEIIAEDWGWCVMCARSPFWLWVVRGNMDFGFPGEQVATPKTEEIVWHCHVVGEKPFWRVFHRIDMKPQVEKLAAQLSSILSSQPEIRLVKEP